MQASASVLSIRSFNRFYTQILGLLNRRFLGSEQSLTELRVLLEISRTVRCTANMLSAKLEIDRSYMSRIIKHLAKIGYIEKTPATHDQRVNFISLTRAGYETLLTMNRHAEDEISSLIEPLNQQQTEQIIAAMQTIRSVLSAAAYPLTIRPFRETDLENLSLLQRTLYEEEFGFSSQLSRAAEEELCEFARKTAAKNECLLVAEQSGKAVGSIGVMPDAKDKTIAKLSCFFLEANVRGRGFGRALLSAALDFCRQAGYRKAELVTPGDLPTAGLLCRRCHFTNLGPSDSPLSSGLKSERWQLELNEQ